MSRVVLRPLIGWKFICPLGRGRGAQVPDARGARRQDKPGLGHQQAPTFRHLYPRVNSLAPGLDVLSLPRRSEVSMCCCCRRLEGPRPEVSPAVGPAGWGRPRCEQASAVRMVSGMEVLVPGGSGTWVLPGAATPGLSLAWDMNGLGQGAVPAAPSAPDFIQLDAPSAPSPCWRQELSFNEKRLSRNVEYN